MDERVTVQLGGCCDGLCLRLYAGGDGTITTPTLRHVLLGTDSDLFAERRLARYDP